MMTTKVLYDLNKPMHQMTIREGIFFERYLTAISSDHMKALRERGLKGNVSEDFIQNKLHLGRFNKVGDLTSAGQDWVNMALLSTFKKYAEKNKNITIRDFIKAFVESMTH